MRSAYFVPASLLALVLLLVATLEAVKPISAPAITLPLDATIFASASSSASSSQPLSDGGLWWLGSDPAPALRGDDCKEKDLKLLEKMNRAKLTAHRCLLKDTVVWLPPPVDAIPELMHPTHVVVQRCTGLCLERPGCECMPKKRHRKKVEIMLQLNASSQSYQCASVELEEHHGGCKCGCLISSCHYNKVLVEDECACRCKADLGETKAACARDFQRQWNEDTCTCKCRPKMCVSGYYQDRTTCECRPIEPPACSAPSSASAAGHHPNSHQPNGLDVGVPSSTFEAPKYIGLSCVVAIAAAMLLALYMLVSKRRGDDVVASANSAAESVFGTLQRAASSAVAHTAAMHNMGNGMGSVSHAGTLRPTAAYTITINQSSSSSMDEAILPLTEDKTRF